MGNERATAFFDAFPLSPGHALIAPRRHEQTVGHAHLHLISRYAGDVSDPRGGIRWIIPARVRYWELT